MKRLIVDIGNSRTKAAIFEDRALREIEEYDISKKGIEHFGKFVEAKDFEQVGYATTADDKNPFVQLIRNELGNQSVQVTGTTPTPLTNTYENPEELGADRLAGVVGAQTASKAGGCLVIDMGSAITYDYFTTEPAVYHGGAITPGMNMRFRALKEFTGKLPRVKAEKNFAFPGKSTEQSIRAGVIGGIISELSGFLYHFHQQGNAEGLDVVLTGGDAAFFENHIKNVTFVEPHLVLIGINALLEYNHA